MRPLADRHLAWVKASAALGLIVFGPFLLFATPLAVIARIWRVLLVEAVFVFFMAVVIGAMAGVAQPPLVWLEGHLRAWVGRFSADPETLWLDWARHAHHPSLAQACLDHAVQLGGREAIFQEALLFLEGGYGSGGHRAGVDRLRCAAQRGHAEAAFMLAEALRTGQGGVLAETQEAELWYRRAATSGFGPAAAWLSHAYQTGDGVPVDVAKSEAWALAAERLRPFPAPSRNLLGHDAAPQDPLVGWGRGLLRGTETLAGRAVLYRGARWVMVLGLGGLSLLVVSLAVAFFWVGSAGLFHLPLFMLMVPVLLLTWQAIQLRRGGPKTGRDRLREAAEAGDPEACYRLGLTYRQGGPHRPKDDLTAALWLRKAAEAGHREAMTALSKAYLGGHGVLRDPREAARWADAARCQSTS